MLVSLNHPTMIDVGYSGTNGVYVYVKPMPTAVDILLGITKRLGLEVDPDDLHVTVMYSRKACVGHPSPSQVHPSFLSSVSIHEGHDKKKYLAARLVSKTLHELHEKWRSRGAKHSYPDFMPHVTLWSDIEDTQLLRERLATINSEIAAHKPMCMFYNESMADLKD